MFLNTKKMIAIYAAIIFFVGLDRFLKILAVQGYQFRIIGEILKFKLQANYYIAFSLPLYGVWLNAAILLIILMLVYYLIKTWCNGLLAAAVSSLIIIFGGGSNLYDRLKYGYVVDYLDLKYFTVFNLADAMIVAGVIYLLFSIKKEAKN